MVVLSFIHTPPGSHIRRVIGFQCCRCVCVGCLCVGYLWRLNFEQFSRHRHWPHTVKIDVDVDFLRLSFFFFYSDDFQVLGQFYGGRSRWGYARMSPQRRPCHHPTSQGRLPNADHLSLPEEGQTGPPSAVDGRRGVGQSHLGIGTLGRQVSWVY